MPRPRLMLSIALLSSAILAYQLQLMHFLSLVQWHHFAFMVISVALLAFGAGGTLLVLFRRWFIKHLDMLLPFLMIITGFLMSIITRISRLDIFNFDSYRLFLENEQFLNLFINYLLFFLPFLSGALAIGLVYMVYTKHTGSYYFADLIGAGTGGPLAILLFMYFEPSQISPLIAFIPILAGSLILVRKQMILMIILIVLFSANNIFLLNREISFNHSEYKDISKTLLLPEVKTLEEENSPMGLLAVMSSPVMRYAPGLSVNYSYQVPNCLTVFNNGNWSGAILPESTTPVPAHIYDFTSLGLPYAINQKSKVLIPGSGTGNEIAQALQNDANNVTGVEPNRELIQIIEKDFAEYSGALFENDKVHIAVTEPRTYLARSDQKYDLIMIPLLGAFGGSIGLQAMQEENLLTIESFLAMWGRLSDIGMVCISGWLDYPVRYPYKIAASLAECLDKAGVENPKEHVVAVKSWGTISFCMKKSRFTDAEVDSVKKFSETMGFENVLLPFSSDENLSADIESEELSTDSVINALFSGNREEIYKEYNFKIKPATDNKPYFSQFLKWNSFLKYREVMAEGTAAFLELGYLIIVVTFLQLLILSVIFIVLPLFRLGWRGGKKGWVLLYFGALGVGFMFVEIVFIRYFTLFLGHPVYATAFVLTALLIFSGAGSLTSSKFSASGKSILRLTLAIAILLFISVPGIEWFIGSGIHFGFSVRIILATLFIALPSFLMGMAFPLGLRLLDRTNNEAVPWAWGINGCLSVISTALATIIAVEGGFRLVLVISALCYLLAAVATVVSISAYARKLR